MRRIYVFKVSNIANDIEIPAHSFPSALASLGRKMNGYMCVLNKRKITITLEETKSYEPLEEKRNR